jgi:hypothetical protein
MSIENRIEAAVSTIESTATNAPAHIAAMQGHENSVENAASAAIGAMIEWKDYQPASWVSGTTYSSRKVLFNSAGTIYAPINDGYVAGASIEDDLAAGELFAYQGLTLADIANLDQTLEGTSGFVVSAEHAKAALDEAFGRINISRNRIVNPSMAISQENGDGPTAAVGGKMVYISDQWRTRNNSDGSIEAQRGLINNVPTSKVLVTAAVPDLSALKDCGRIQQLIESKNVYDLNGNTCTLSFVVNVNWTGNLSIALQKSDGSRSYVTDVSVVSGLNFVYKTITLEGDTILTNDTNIGLYVVIGLNNEGFYQASTPDAWQAGTKLCSDVSTQWTKTINNYVEITNVDLYAGNVPREFVPNSYAQDLAECQRYFRKIDGTSSESLGIVGASNPNGNPVFIGTFPVEMRGVPAISFLNLVATAITGPIAGISAIVNSGTTNKAFRLNGTAYNAFISGAFVYLRASAIPSYLSFDARL